MSNAQHTNCRQWKRDPDEHDYPAAADYLGLLCPPKIAKKTARALRDAPLIARQAKDLLRASALELLPTDNVEVESDLTKVHKGQQLSPVLLVRGSLADGRALVVADGYHRICASYHLDAESDIPCRIVDMPA